MPNSFLDKFFKPEMERVMAALRAVDDKIRAELSGKTINGQTPDIESSAKDILKDARRNFARREYMTGVADLGMFHKKMALVAAEISKWEVDVNRIHHRFLFQGVNEDKIKGLREHMESKKAEEINELIKQAGMFDFFYNLMSTRGRGLAAYEKKYPKQTKDLREGGAKLLDAADALLNNTISLLKEMATARATRRPDDYMDAANKIVAEYNKFDGGDKGFRNYYQKAVLPFMEIKDKMEEKLKNEKPESVPVDYKAPQKMELGYQVPKETPAPSAPTTTPTVAPSGAQPMGTWMTVPVPGMTPAPKQEDVITVNPEDPDVELVSPQPGDKTDKSPPPTHSSFYSILNKMSGEDPLIISSYISKYARSIQGSDPETAIKLFTIAKSLRG